MTTIRELVEEAWDDLMDRRDSNPGDMSDLIPEVCGATIPAMTTTLFQMVVDDNTLAFIDYDGDATDPFGVLAGCILQEVEEKVRERYESFQAGENEENEDV